MKEWKVLALLEYEWRMFRIYRKIINRLVKMRFKLTSPILCFLGKQLDRHDVMALDLKYLYEKQTGKVIVFFKSDEF